MTFGWRMCRFLRLVMMTSLRNKERNANRARMEEGSCRYVCMYVNMHI